MTAAHQDKRPESAGRGAPSAAASAWTIDPLPEGLIDSPLDFIFAEHHRQRVAASILAMAADGAFDREGMDGLIAFLERDFALHVGDEEIVLFPILRQRCRPEDGVERIIDRLQEEHRGDEEIGAAALDVLKAVARGQPLSPDSARLLRRFAEHIRQHLALENGVLLPIARVRLDERSLAAAAEMLRERRAPRRR